MKNDFTQNFAIRRIVEISIVNTVITASNIALFLFELENINLRVHEIVSPEKQKMKVCDTWSARAFVNINVRYLMVVNTPPSFKICIWWCDNSNVARSFVRQRGSRRITWESTMWNCKSLKQLFCCPILLINVNINSNGFIENYLTSEKL